MRSLDVCPICYSPDSREIYRFIPALWIPGRVVRCTRCHTIYKIPADITKPLADCYDQSYAELDYWAQEQEAIRALSKMIEQITGTVGTEPLSLLDIGCGSGVFLALAQRAGFKVAGLELNPALAGLAREKSGAEVWVGDFTSADLHGQRFDLITMLDLIEHLVDPLAAVQRCSQLLKPGGRLVIYTPNHGGLIVGIANLLYRLSGGRVRQPIVEIFDCTHVTFFDVATLQLIIREAGLDVEKTTMLKYDPERSRQATGMLALGLKGIEIVSALFNGQFRILMFARK